jgi:hypothetical protein
MLVLAWSEFSLLSKPCTLHTHCNFAKPLLKGMKHKFCNRRKERECNITFFLFVLFVLLSFLLSLAYFTISYTIIRWLKHYVLLDQLDANVIR